jgi:hypothetical protein
MEVPARPHNAGMRQKAGQTRRSAVIAHAMHPVAALGQVLHRVRSEEMSPRLALDVLRVVAEAFASQYSDQLKPRCSRRALLRRAESARSTRFWAPVTRLSHSVHRRIRNIEFRISQLCPSPNSTASGDRTGTSRRIESAQLPGYTAGVRRVSRHRVRPPSRQALGMGT